MNARKSSGRQRNQHVTKSGNVFKVHRNMTERWVAKRDAKEKRRAARLATLPKSKIKRFFYHFQPKRMYQYWFSRDGAIMALKIMGLAFVVGFILLVGVFAYFRKDLPNLNDPSGNNIGGSIRYYDKTGKTLLYEDYDAVKRIPVKTEDISKYVRMATVATEDKDFYKHGGFDVRGIIRAGLNDVFGSGGTQGGSTITQQLVKLSLDWTDQRTITRKAKEVILAVELERSYSKDDILTGYLNTAPYGNIEYGVESAARDYFHKSAKDLTLDESTFLAAIPKSPSIYSPYGPYYDKKDLIARQHYILDSMVDQGLISKDQATKAKKIDTTKKVHKQEAQYSGIKAPYFVLAAKDELEQKYGSQTVNRSGWKVITTLDLKLQSLADKAVQDDRPTIQRYGGDTAAFVAEDVKTGQIVSLVGGVDFGNKDFGKINYAHDAQIPPGSSFKPYDYVSLIEHTNTAGAGSVLYDSLGPLPGYPCTDHSRPPPRGSGNCLTDYDFRTPGAMTLRYALGGSRNIPAVKANLIVGTDKVIQTANDLMGTTDGYNCYSDVKLTKKTQCYGASAIGDGAYLQLDNHVNGFASLARLGKSIPRTYILKISNASDKAVYQFKQPEGKQAVRQDSAYIIDNMASDPNASYLPYGYYKFHRYKGWDFAIKTGTTNNGFDGLMASWSTKYATVAWVGHHTRNVEMSGFMEYMTAPIIRTWMQGAHDLSGDKPSNWKQPSDIKTLPAYVIRSHVGIGSVEPSPSKDIYPSWYKSSKDQNVNKPIDLISKKLATDCTPSLARKSSSNSNSNAFSVDIFVDKQGSGANTSANDDVHKCDDSRPTIDSISLAGGGSTCTSPCTINVSISAGTHPLYDSKYASVSGSGTVKLLVDGKSVQSKQASPSVSFTYSGSGTKNISAQVIDSVLYDATSSQKTINFQSASSNLSGFTAIASGSTTTFTWSGGTPNFTIYYDPGGPAVGSDCEDISDHTCSVPKSSASPGTKVYIIDSNGDKLTATVGP